MKKFLLTGVALAALACGPALAADLPARRAMPVKAPEPVATGYDWSGFYIGAHAGGGWSERCFTFAGASDGCHDADGWLGGGQVGFNVQSGQWVFGVEFSGSWADISGEPRCAADSSRSLSLGAEHASAVHRARRHELRSPADLRDGRWRMGA